MKVSSSRQTITLFLHTFIVLVSIGFAWIPISNTKYDKKTAKLEDLQNIQAPLDRKERYEQGISIITQILVDKIL